MAKRKRNPFDLPPPPPKTPNTNVFRPDADLRNADWTKRRGDVSADGSIIKPVAVPYEKP